MENYQLKISKYIRLLSTNSTLKVNEFKQDETLLSYATHFKRIKNLLRNAEWNVFENKKQNSGKYRLGFNENFGISEH